MPTNILQAVQTFNKAELGALQNSYAALANSNTLFDDFQDKIVSNLGTSVTMRLRYKFATTNGLSATLQGIEQRPHTLTVDQAESVNFAVTDQQRLFNLKTDAYLKEVGGDAAAELGSRIEESILRNADSSVPVNTGDLSSPTPTGAVHTESGPYLFYGDGVTAINSYQQLREAVVKFNNLGSVKTGMKIFLPDVKIPAIVGNELTKFAIDRNNKIVNSWEIGDFGTPPVKFLSSNLLPIHVSGTIGNSTTPNDEVTVTGTVTNAAGDVIAIVGTTTVTTDSNAVASGDVLQFVDSVSGHPNMRFLTFYGKHQSAQAVQVRSTAKVASSGGALTIPIFPYLTSASGAKQNINNAIAAGMKLKVYPSHQCGLLVSGNAMFTAVPRLPTTEPYTSSVETDSESGVSMRMYAGYVLSESTFGLFRNCVWGSTIVPEYSMRILFPL